MSSGYVSTQLSPRQRTYHSASPLARSFVSRCARRQHRCTIYVDNGNARCTIVDMEVVLMPNKTEQTNRPLCCFCFAEIMGGQIFMQGFDDPNTCICETCCKLQGFIVNRVMVDHTANPYTCKVYNSESC